MCKCAILGLGSNLGDCPANLQTAVRALALLPGTKITAASRLYQTQPVGFTQQPLFYNACLVLETALSPRVLLGACLGIEAAMGRRRMIANGPRVLDLDLLLYEGASLCSPELTLPHPRMTQRAFVMVPLRELYPDGNAPGLQFDPDLYGLDPAGVEITALQLFCE